MKILLTNKLMHKMIFGLSCMIFTGLTFAINGPFQYRDQFDSVSYNNSDGTTDWSAETWDETGDDDSASSGGILITGNRLRFNSGGATDTIQRSLDLENATTATLSFDWEFDGATEDCNDGTVGDEINVLIRAQSSDAFTQIGADICGEPDENSGTFSESIPSSFFTSTAEIQILADGFAGGTEFFFVENLNIVGDASVAATTINIGDTVWYDLDSDGNFDSNEVAIANVSLNLFANLTCTGPAIDNTVTNASGNYSFEPENTGDYCVQVVESSLPAIGYIATTGGFTQSVNAPSIGNYTDLDFGFEATSCLPVINFDTYPNGLDTVAGDIITDQFAPWGITVSATGGSGDAMIFDGNNPTGGDDDLGSPHESFGGPGVGVAGVFGAVGENRIPQNRLLIISEDGDQSDPDDNGPGGTMFFTFERDLNMDELLFLDFGDTLGVDAGEARFYDEFDVLVETASTLPSVGDNGLGGLTFTATGIRRIEVQFNQSGSMAKFAICPAIIRESAVGDLVWLDIDSDGVFDVGEPGLPNVSVSLYDAGPDGISGNSDDFLIGTTQTGSDGSYLFAGLVGSDYYVEVDETTLPSNDLTLSTGSTNPLTVFTLADNSENFDQDFPYSNDSSDNAIVGDLVWSDADADGIRDPGESGISGVTLDLIDVSNNMVVATTTTGADGQYLFTNVPPGEYIVEVTDTNTELTGYTLTTGPQSNPSPSEPFEVAAGDVLLTLDFGYDNNTLFSISDRVWLDSDNDGVFDGGENGIENVTVNLLNDNGVVIATALTDENGDFTFPGLEDGDYQIQVSDAYNELTNYQSTTTPAENGFLEVTLNSANINNISFGYNNSGTIGDTIWNDADGDGVQDDNEIGIAGVELTLYFDENNDGIFNGSDTIVNQTTTDALGYYIFEDLIGTDYVVFIDSLQAALTDYTQTADPDEVGICSTCDSQSGTSLNLGGSDLEQDFGYQNSALFDISGNVFEDLDADGIDDGVGEPGFESVTLSLIISGDDGIYGTADDVVLATTATDSAGDYIFPDLPDDDYRVEVTDNTNILNDYSLTSGLDQIDVTLAGVDITDVDFGYVRNSGTASIGDYVWIDSNADGVQDNNESGIQSVALNLYNPGPDGVIGGGDDILVATTATDVFGSYDFQGLDAGSYYVDVDDSTLPAGLTLSPTLSDPTSIISLSDGEDYNDADFGYSTQANTSILGDLVWADTDGDGIRDPGELGIAGVDLDLIGAGPDDIFGTGDDISLTTTTAANGSYLFTDLTPGMYTVTVDTSDVPVAYSSTPTNADVTYQVTTLGDDSFLHLDWGFTPNPATTGSIGDTIWLDTDSDGIEDAGEPGIENVTVNLIGAGNDGVFGNNDDEILATTVTNNQGYYIFSGIQPDDYQVEVSDTNGVLVGMNQTSPAIGSISLSADEDYETADFGYAPGPGSIGNLVFLDADADGFRDPTEAGIEGAILNLWQDVNGNGMIDNDGTDNLLRQTTTNTNGNYSFNGLPNEAYLVELASSNFDSGGILEDTIQTFGTADTDSNGQTSPYPAVISSGTPQIITADFGVVGDLPYSLSGTIFEDSNDNTDLTPGEPSIEAAVVTLYRDINSNGIIDAADSQYGSITTDSSGFYQYDGLPNGDYIVTSHIDNTRVAGYEQTTQTITNGLQLATINNADSIENDFGYFNGGVSTTAVTLAYFESELINNEVNIKFGTSTETGNLGFTIYQEAAYGKIENRVNFIKTKTVDSIQLSDYQNKFQLIDSQPLWMTDTDINGKVTIHGPFEIGKKYGFKNEQQSIDWNKIKSTHFANNKNSQLSVDTLDIHINKTGMYRVTHDQLVNMGLDLTGYESKYISLKQKTTDGNISVARTINDKIFGVNSYIEFFGTENKGFYSNNNVYQLSTNTQENPIIPKAEIEVKDIYQSAHEKAIFSIADNNEYSYISPNGDPWYHQSFVAINSPLQTDVNVELNNLFNPKATIDFKLFGVTDFPGSANDHHLKINWNNETIVDEWADGQADMSYSIPLSINQEQNVITFDLPLDTGFSYDLINLESISIAYNRKLVSSSDHYIFEVQLTDSNDSVDLIFSNGFEQIGKGFYVDNVQDENFKIYAINGQSPIELSNVQYTGAPNYQILVPSVLGVNDYIIIQNSEYLTPEFHHSSFANDLLLGEADYLILSHSAFINDLQLFKTFHENNGLVVKIVNVDDIYAQYSASRVDAYAIQSYLKDAAEALNIQMVLLVGGDSYDYHDNLELGSLSFIPTLYKPTSEVLNFSPSDSALVDFDNDNVPDLPIGRFPVRTLDELANIVQKTIDYSTKTYQDSILFVADNSEPDASFSSYSNDMIINLPENWSYASSYLDYDSVQLIKSSIIEEVNSGLAVLNFFGHSGPTRWAFEGLFDTTNAVGLTNYNKPTVVNQWGCWNTYFVSPYADTLAHKFLLSGNQGAAAVLGPTTLTQVASEQLLGNISMPLLTTPNMRIGEAIMLAKQKLAEDNSDMLDVLLGYSLLGDPALIISK